MQKVVVLVAVAALVMLGMATTMVKYGAKVVYAHEGDVVGTWIVTVNVNTPPGAPPFVFTDFIAFNEGGTLVATSNAFNPQKSMTSRGTNKPRARLLTLANIPQIALYHESYQRKGYGAKSLNSAQE
jgi:hypothetical protein